MSARIVIIGAGGHARVVADVLDMCDTPALGHIDRDTSLPGVIGDDADLPKLIESEAITHFVIGIGSVRGGAGLRARLFDRTRALGLSAYTAVHPSAVVARSARLGAGTVVMAGAVINPGVETGENVIVSTGAIIDHDGRIGAHSHIAPGCVLSGDVAVGPHSLLGTATTARQGVRVGRGTTIGAGSLLLGQYDDDAVYVGHPARRRD